MKRKTASSQPTKIAESNDEEKEELYEVEKILADAFHEGEFLYQTKWVGYDEMTWEPRESFKGCPHVLMDYEKTKVKRKKRRARSSRSKSGMKTPTRTTKDEEKDSRARSSMKRKAATSKETSRESSPKPKAATSKEKSRESSPKPKAGSRARSTTNVESTVEQEVQSREGQDDGVGDDDDGLKVCDQFAIAIQECGMPLGPGRKPITGSDHFAIELANFCEQQATGADIMLHMDAGEVPPPLTEQRAFPALDALLAPPIDHGSITSLSTTLSSTSLPSTGFSSATGLASAALLTLSPVVQQTPAKSPAAAPTAQNFTKEQEDFTIDCINSENSEQLKNHYDLQCYATLMYFKKLI